jgi:hypothetical protein
MSGLTMQFFASPHAVLRRLALSAVNQFVVLFPPVRFDTHAANADVYCRWVMRAGGLYIYLRFAYDVVKCRPCF